jgi:predicted heme/steroid binding protein
MRRFSREELSRCDGREGRPACIAFQGNVYDVTQSFLWKGGEHQVLHSAGRDLSGELSAAPHGADLLDRVPVVGILE